MATNRNCALSFFLDFFGPGLWLLETPSQFFVKKFALLCNPLLNMLESFTCSLKFPATFIMIFQNSKGNFNALIFPCCHQFLSNCLKESSKFWRQFEAVKFCKFCYALVQILNAAEMSTTLPPFQCKLNSITMWSTN